MPETLFISDLHLDKERPHIIDLFQRFLTTDARQADALYILGDLFEYWLGDDDPAPGLESAISGMKRLADSGIPVYFIHGNRDFLIGKQFSQRTGCHLLAESHVIDLLGESTLLMHGDTLCTDDIAYQAFRDKIRHKIIQHILLSLSLKVRQRIANWLRHKSRQEVGYKPAAVMDVNQLSVEKAMSEYKVRLLIHGHTHRPAIHKFQLHDQPATRIVLGDWYKQGSVLCVNQRGYELKIIE